jgi:gamma-glutamylcyclotransferase (GGCT)/AIG2-like uncharacterized protein YtfP
MMPQPEEATRHVFVYGTLRRGERNDIARYRPLPIFVGEASVDGRLYDLGAYPGVVLGAGRRVVGEVYRITAEVEAALDILEEVKADGSGEYRKRDVPVVLGEQTLRCLVYEIHPERLVGRYLIASGDWRTR